MGLMFARTFRKFGVEHYSVFVYITSYVL